MKYIFSFILFLITSYCYPQISYDGGNSYFQEIIVTHDNTDVCFMRESVDFRRWGNWMQRPPRDSDAQIFKPKYLTHDYVEGIIGKEMIEWLNKRPRISGYYNFTKNKKYDWEKFGGESYGTYSKPILFRVEQ